MEQSNNQDIDDILKSKHVIDLLTLANEYCLFIEKCRDYQASDIIDYLRKVLPMVYLKGSMLPELSADEDYITEKFVSEEHYENIYNALKEIFASFPSDLWADQKSGSSELSELLTDVYQDLKDFVVLFQKALTVEKQNALADCQTAFQPYWGARLAEAIPLVHRLYAAPAPERTDSDSWNSLWDE